MSKTLSLKKTTFPTPEDSTSASAPEAPIASAQKPQAYTADELRAMLTAMGEPVARVITDPTMDLSIDDLPAHVIADKSALPPIDERTAGAVQVPPRVYGKFGLNGIPLIAPGVDLSETINPATGQPYAQIGVRAVTQIQAPPQNFSRRRG